MQKHLEPFYNHTGRPSIDPELMIRLLLIGYCYGIRSERRLCEGFNYQKTAPGHEIFKYLDQETASRTVREYLDALDNDELPE